MPPQQHGPATSTGVPSEDLQKVLSAVGARWDDLRGGSILVTGGSGFIGRWMLETLLSANDALGLGCRILVLTRRPQRLAQRAPDLAAHRSVTLHAGDVAAFWLPPGELTHVLHLAKEPGAPVTDGGPSIDPRAAAPGTRRVLELAVERGARRLLFTSSGAVYGRLPTSMERVAEDSPTNTPARGPHRVYAAQKRAAEQLCLTAQDRADLDIAIARCFTFVGPIMDFEGVYAVGNFVRDAVIGNVVTVAGDGKAVRSYLYAADLAVWLWTVLLSGTPGRAYNVGSPQAVSIADLAQLVSRTLGDGSPPHIRGAGRDTSYAPDRYVPDTTLAQTTLGLSVDTPLEEALRRTAAWYRAQACD